MNFICSLKSYYDVHECVKAYRIFTDNSGYSAFCKIHVCQQLTTSLFSWKLLFVGVFVRSSLCSLSFPYMEISSPVYIMAGIHQEMQFARLPGSVMRRTACNCLSHHLQKKKKKKFWKAIASVTTLKLMKRRREGWRMGEKLFIYAAIYIAPSWCQWNILIFFGCIAYFKSSLPNGTSS